MKNISKILIITCVSFLFWIFLFEITATYWVRNFGDPLIQAKEVLDIDPFMGWHQKLNFRGNFLKLPLNTNEIGLRNKSLSELSNTSKKILVLGPSSTFGWGVNGHETYSAILEELLEKEYPNFDIDVINAGQIGFSSWQGVKFYKKEKLGRLDADIIIIAYGINDVDKFRFFYNSSLSDEEEFKKPKSGGRVTFLNSMNKLNFVNLFAHKASKLIGYIKCENKYLPERRVKNSDFVKNITELIQLGQAQGSKIVLLTSPYSLPSFDPIGSERKDLSIENFKLGKVKYNNKEYIKALNYFKKSLESNPDQNKIYYYMSSCYSMMGDCLNSHKMFSRARIMEPKRITKDIDALNNLLIEISKIENIPLVKSITSINSSNNKHFADPIHLSLIGNKTVANKLVNVILRKDLLAINHEKP